MKEAMAISLSLPFRKPVTVTVHWVASVTCAGGFEVSISMSEGCETQVVYIPS